MLVILQMGSCELVTRNFSVILQFSFLQWAFFDKAWPSLVFHWRLLWVVNWPCGWIQSVPFTPQVVHTTLQFWQFNSPSYCTRLSHENHHQIICLGSDHGGVRCGWTINYFPIKTKKCFVTGQELKFDKFMNTDFALWNAEFSHNGSRPDLHCWDRVYIIYVGPYSLKV